MILSICGIPLWFQNSSSSHLFALFGKCFWPPLPLPKKFLSIYMSRPINLHPPLPKISVSPVLIRHPSASFIISPTKLLILKISRTSESRQVHMHHSSQLLLSPLHAATAMLWMKALLPYVSHAKVNPSSIHWISVETPSKVLKYIYQSPSACSLWYENHLLSYNHWFNPHWYHSKSQLLLAIFLRYQILHLGEIHFTPRSYMNHNSKEGILINFADSLLSLLTSLMAIWLSW